MAHAGGTLNDWLTASAYVRGRDETSAVLSRKKCRSRRRRAGSGSEVLHIESAQQAREMLISCKLGTRRYRRWMNDRLLRELAPPLDALEIGSLFAPPPWGEKSVVSPLERVTASPHDMALWEPFRNNVDMDLQAKLLQQADQRRKVSAKGKEGRLTAAFTAWSGVERNLRAALRRNSASPVLQELEDKLRTLWKGRRKSWFLKWKHPTIDCFSMA